MLSVPGFITIRFIKSDSNSDDDIITIRPIDGQVSVIMTGITTSQKSATQAALRMSHDDCLRWFVRTTNLLSTDDYPIGYVQFDFPFCPSVMYKLENLDQHMHVVYDMLSFQLSLWNASIPSQPVRAPLEASRPAPIEIPPPQPVRQSGCLASAFQPPLEAFDDDDVLNMAFIEEGRAAGRHSQQKGRHHLFFDE
jgi:hypothetical protein